MFGLELRIARIRAGLKLFELATKAGVEETRLSRIENSRRIPRPDEIQRLESALGVKLPPVQEASDGCA
ncbi:MAG: helix-turn-helix protein [Blastocatellia bacterium]